MSQPEEELNAVGDPAGMAGESPAEEAEVQAPPPAAPPVPTGDRFLGVPDAEILACLLARATAYHGRTGDRESMRLIGALSEAQAHISTRRQARGD